MDQAGEGAPTVGLVGDDDRVATAVADAADATPAGDADAVLGADPDLVVAVGEASVLAVARRRPAVPVLPVAAGSGLQSVPTGAVADALARYGSDEFQTASHPLLSVSVDGERAGTALLDAGVVTAEPARLAEFAVTASGDSVATDGEPVATVRADGIVAATPAGTTGYARAVGLPVIPPGPAVLAVGPIAPFETDPRSWVLPGDVTVVVERDAVPVAVLADDRTVATVGADEPVTIGRDGNLQAVVVPESASPFGPGDGELEKL